MANKNMFLGFILFNLLITLSSSQMVPAVFVFGDSLVDVGNNNHLPLSIVKANFPHNGVDFPNKKATGRFSNGKNAADFLAEKVGLPTSPPYLSVKNDVSAFMTGVSFASGGAGIFNGTDQSMAQSIPLTHQVGYYEIVHGKLVQKLGSPAAESLLSKSLFAIVIGSNDIFGYTNSTDPNKGTPQQYVDLMILTLKGLVKRIYDHGGRKFFIAGVGPVGCCPSRRLKDKINGDCNEEINSIAGLYNQKVKSMLQQLNAELKGVSYSYFDTYTTLGNMVQNPSQYGFVEVKAACCGLGTLRAKVPCLPIAAYCSNRTNHVFWDLFHPTEEASKIIVDTLFDGPSNYAFPVNVRQLVTV